MRLSPRLIHVFHTELIISDLEDQQRQILNVQAGSSQDPKHTIDDIDRQIHLIRNPEQDPNQNYKQNVALLNSWGLKVERKSG